MAIARPIPVRPPVTAAFLPLRSCCCMSISDKDQDGRFCSAQMKLLRIHQIHLLQYSHPLVRQSYMLFRPSSIDRHTLVSTRHYSCYKAGKTSEFHVGGICYSDSTACFPTSLKNPALTPLPPLCSFHHHCFASFRFNSIILPSLSITLDIS